MKKSLLKYLIFTLCFFSAAGINAEEGLDIDMILLKLNKELKTLNKEILSLKDNNELLSEELRLNSEKITELFEIIELNSSKKEKIIKTTKTDSETKALKLFSDGKSSFVLEDYQKAIKLFSSYLDAFPNSINTEDSKLWLARSYFASGSSLRSKEKYQEFHANGNKDHPKFADSLYELSITLIDLKEFSGAKVLLSKMIDEYPDHALNPKANQLLEDL
mgnify:FL=1